MKLFIDGSSGTTGLRIRQRLAQRPDVELITLPDEERRDVERRRWALNHCDAAFLCLPDDAARQDELAALMAERERRAAAKGGQRNIPGMPKRKQEQPAPAPSPTQTKQQPAPNGEEAAAEPAQGKDRAASIAQLAKDTGLDEGRAERAYNIALSQYRASRRRGGNRSFESFLNAQATWMMTHGRQGKGRTGRR